MLGGVFLVSPVEMPRGSSEKYLKDRRPDTVLRQLSSGKELIMQPKVTREGIRFKERRNIC